MVAARRPGRAEQGPSPAANCVPAVRTGNLLFMADQVPVQDGNPQFLGVAVEVEAVFEFRD